MRIPRACGWASGGVWPHGRPLKHAYDVFASGEGHSRKRGHRNRYVHGRECGFRPHRHHADSGRRRYPDTFADAFVTAINSDATLSANNVLAHRATGCTGFSSSQPRVIQHPPRMSLGTPERRAFGGFPSSRQRRELLQSSPCGLACLRHSSQPLTRRECHPPHPVTVTTAQSVTFSPVQFVIQKSDSYNSATVPVTETSAVTVGQLCFLWLSGQQFATGYSH